MKPDTKFLKDLPLWNEEYIRSSPHLAVLDVNNASELQLASAYIQTFSDYRRSIQSYQNKNFLTEDQKKYIWEVYEERANLFDRSGYLIESQEVREVWRKLPFFDKIKKLKALESLILDEIKEADESCWKTAKYKDGRRYDEIDEDNAHSRNVIQRAIYVSATPLSELLRFTQVYAGNISNFAIYLFVRNVPCLKHTLCVLKKNPHDIQELPEEMKSILNLVRRQHIHITSGLFASDIALEIELACGTEQDYQKAKSALLGKGIDHDED